MAIISKILISFDIFVFFIAQFDNWKMFNEIFAIKIEIYIKNKINNKFDHLILSL